MSSSMQIGYQGESHSYSYRATTELFPEADAIGFRSFVAAFNALDAGEINKLVLPVENSTTGSVLPVLDRLPGNGDHSPISIVAEHLVEVRHALLACPGATLDTVKVVRSHPQALAQAQETLLELGLEGRPSYDTAGAVRKVAENQDPAVAALANVMAGTAHGLVVLRENVMDKAHNTTRFVVLAPGRPEATADANKSTILFRTAHTPGALALALTELGLRGANLTRIESRPSGEAWSYRFFVDLLHEPGPEGLKSVLEPPLGTLSELRVLGSYVAAQRP